MKYVIDVPDIDRYLLPSETRGSIIGIPMSVDNHKCIISTDIEYIGPYTEPDFNVTKDNPVHLCESCNRMQSLVPCSTNDEDILFGEDGKSICCCKQYVPERQTDRKAIKDAQEEAWKMASKCLWTITNSQSRVIFGMDGVYVPRDLSYQEAKAKYETWEKQRDEIHVGCEVHHKELPELKIYVTDMDDNSFGGFALCRVEDVCEYGDRFSECNVHQYKPTGRVLPNIVELLKKMKGEEE